MNLERRNIIKDILLKLSKVDQSSTNFEKILNQFVDGIEREQDLATDTAITILRNDIGIKVDQIIALLSLQLGNTIDYMNLPEEVRYTLLLDNTQMLRCRYGLHITNGLPDFEQYCVYAHYQCEALVNYHLFNQCNKNAEIAFFIEKNTLEENKTMSVKAKLLGINYAAKLYKINEIISIEEYNTIRSVNAVRNNFLHRDGFYVTDDSIMQEFINGGLRTIKRIDMSPEQKRINDNYYAIIFKRKANYDKVDIALQELYAKIA